MTSVAPKKYELKWTDNVSDIRKLTVNFTAKILPETPNFTKKEQKRMRRFYGEPDPPKILRTRTLITESGEMMEEEYYSSEPSSDEEVIIDPNNWGLRGKEEDLKVGFCIDEADEANAEQIMTFLADAYAYLKLNKKPSIPLVAFNCKIAYRFWRSSKLHEKLKWTGRKMLPTEFNKVLQRVALLDDIDKESQSEDRDMRMNDALVPLCDMIENAYYELEKEVAGLGMYMFPTIWKERLAAKGVGSVTIYTDEEFKKEFPEVKKK